MKNRWAGLLMLAWLFNMEICFSQSGASTGELAGLITDPSGSVIPGATITASNTSNGMMRTSVSDMTGSYRLLLLPPSQYEVKAEAVGFSVQVRNNIEVKLGETVKVDFSLQVGMTHLSITVTASQPLVDTARISQSGTISERFIRNLPIDRRDYLAFTLLAPGVADSSAMADDMDFRTIQTRPSGLSFYGNNGRGNSVTIDGAEINDSAGGVRAALSQEAVQEFQINRGNYAAEHGGASGGVINIVTKTGGNDLSGSIFGFFRNARLDAADPFAIDLVNGEPQRVKPSSQRQQYGATLGFPIARDRTFFFGAFEGLNRNEFSSVPVLTDLSIFQPNTEQSATIQRLASDTSTVPVPCLPAVPGAKLLPPAFCAQALKGALTSKQPTRDLFQANSGVFPFTSNLKTFSTRLDHQLGTRDQFFFRYSFTRDYESNQNTRALVGVSRSYTRRDFDSTALGGWTRVFNYKFAMDVRLQWSYRHLSVVSNDPNGPEFNITGYGFFNRDFNLPSYSTERRYLMALNFTLVRGSHRLKMGTDNLIRDNATDSYNAMSGRFGFGTLPGMVLSPQLGTASINALQSFDLGLPQFYQQGFGDPRVASTEPYLAFYLQDSWGLRRNLLLNLGVRYEVDDRRDPIPTDKNNIAPRLGLTWDPRAKGKTVIRGGFGMYYAPIYYMIDHVVNSLGEINGYRQIAQVLTTLDAANPSAINGPINIWQTLRAQGVVGVPQTVRPIAASDLSQFGIQVSQTGPRPPLTVLFRIDPDYQNSYSIQSSLGIEQEVMKDLTFSSSYVFVRTLRIPRGRDVNVLPRPVGQKGIREWTAQSGCVGTAIVSCFRDPLLFQDNLYESTANASYNAWILEVNKRFHSGLGFAVNYTYSRAIDDVTDYNNDFEAMDQTNLALERALSAFDQRHKLVAYGYIQGPSYNAGADSWIKHLVSDFVVAPIFRYNSARPFNLLVGGDLNGDRHPTTDRPALAGRNTGVGPSFWAMDLRIARQAALGSGELKLEVAAEAFNLFNHLNFSSVNNTVGPNFAPPFRVTAREDLPPTSALGYTAAFDPRRIQLGFRLRF